MILGFRAEVSPQFFNVLLEMPGDGVSFIIFQKGFSCGQSYKASTIVNYDSRVIIWGIFESGTTIES